MGSRKNSSSIDNKTAGNDKHVSAVDVKRAGLRKFLELHPKLTPAKYPLFSNEGLKTVSNSQGIVK